MEESIMAKKSISTTQQNIESFFETHDSKYIATDAVFTNMSTGEETKGREAIAGMLHYLYHIAFDAKAEIKNTIITGEKALLEADFKGKHVGEFAGLQPTNKEINVPLCVSYHLEDGLIKQARIYMLADVMMRQLHG
ncbi:MAG: ester cyclase [Ginsengibacter sp.]